MSVPLSGLREITYQYLQFEQAPITMHSSGGAKFTRWVDIGMPRIPTELLDTVFYLYKNIEDAKEGSEFGGTGFFVSVPSKEDSRYFHIYAVTNHHNIFRNSYTTLRVNTDEGKPDFIELIPDIDWKYVPGEGDVTVASLSQYINGNIHKVMCVPIAYFATQGIVDEKRIGVGDDVFMLGRFINHAGGPTNAPAARFGNISVMPTRIEPMDNGVKDSYCIDLHSRSGFSGSPVFVYRNLGGDLSRYNVLSGGFIYFLGIHWGQFPELWQIIADKEKLTEATPGLIMEGKYVKGVSGMTCVMPSETILAALNIPQFKEQRREGDTEMKKKFIKYGYPPEPESAKEPIPAENPQHKEDFNSLVSAAAKKKRQDD